MFTFFFVGGLDWSAEPTGPAAASDWAAEPSGAGGAGNWAADANTGASGWD